MSIPNITVTPEKFQLLLGVNDDITISITNVGFDSVMYRLLTTAPERYVVKHTKGVVKGNSTTKIAITLNPKHVLAAAEKQRQSGNGSAVMKDDFRLEYTVQGVNDVIEPRSGNVPQLIKEKKAANPSSVLKKLLRCHILLHAADAATTITTPASAAASARAGAGGGETANPQSSIRMTAQEMRDNTWREKNKRRETAAAAAAAGGGGGAVTRASGNGRGGGLADQSAATQRVQLLLIVFAILAAGGIWMLME